MCEAKVRDLLSKTPGIKNVAINLAKATADIEMGSHISTETLKSALKAYPKYELSEVIQAPVVTTLVKDDNKKSWFVTYKPILVIFAYITAISVITGFSDGNFSVVNAMRVFMAGFFITFSFFKMLDLNGFADSYSMYDIVAKKFRQWAYIYAFVELALGLAYTTNFQPGIINYITLVVMSVSIIGVLQSVFKKQKIKCACLGAVFNLPMSTLTIFEDVLMMAMSIAMIIMMF